MKKPKIKTGLARAFQLANCRASSFHQKPTKEVRKPRVTYEGARTYKTAVKVDA